MSHLRYVLNKMLKCLCLSCHYRLIQRAWLLKLNEIVNYRIVFYQGITFILLDN
jgi:hypothetical protein